MSTTRTITKAFLAVIASLLVATATDTQAGVTAIATGAGSSCMVVNGAVMCWGDNTNGQIGNNSTVGSKVPIQVVGLTTGATAVSVGTSHACAVVSGAVWCWGNNALGRLGNGNNTNSLVPVPVSGLGAGVTSIASGFEHSCATVSGSVKCWGGNGLGQLGDGTNTASNVPVQVSALTSLGTAVSAGFASSCAVVNGGVKCWGNNGSGQLGNSTFTTSSVPVQVSGVTSGVTGLAGIKDHVCAIHTSGAAKCWGGNASGQLGNMTTTTNSAQVQVVGLTSGVSSIAAGNSHSCAVDSAGAAQCWGIDTDGQLGNNTGGQTLVPGQVSTLSTGVTVVAAGSGHSCAVVSMAAQCWGNNASGQLGDNSLTSSQVPVAVATFTVPDPPIIGTAIGGNGQATIAFSAPGSNGGSAITGYTVTASPGGLSGIGASPPLTILGLTNNTAYTFTVTATNAGGTSPPSALSNSVTPAVPGPFVVTVTSTADAGAGSLRQALLDVQTNCAAPTKTVNFNIGGTGPHPITLASGLPGLSCANTTVDGYSQSGAFANTGPISSNNANIQILVNGAANSCFVIGASNVTIKGLAIHSCSFEAIYVVGGNALILGNYLGTDPGGMTGFGNGGGGNIKIDGSASGAQIGDGTLAGINFITAHAGANVQLFNSSASTVNTNMIGGDRSGGSAVASSGRGIECSGGCGLSFITANRIHRQGGSGVFINTMNNGVKISQNNIFATVAKGIDTSATGNSGIQKPGITSVTYDPSGTTILGSYIPLDATPHTLEIFENPTAPSVPSGKLFYKSIVLTEAGGNGIASFSFSDLTPGIHKNISVTVRRNTTGDTSEFNNLFLTPVPTVAVTFASAAIFDGGSTSLRFTLTDASALAQTDIVLGDTLPAGLRFTSVAPTVTFTGTGGTCTGTSPASYVVGTRVLSVSGISLGAGATSCTVDVAGLTNEVGQTGACPVVAQTNLNSNITATNATVSGTDQCLTVNVLTVNPVVINVSDSVVGSFRQAILAVNASCSITPQTITFAIPGAGPHIIAPMSMLPTIDCPDTTIDGYSQTGGAGKNSLATASSTTDLRIIIDGVGAGPVDGIGINAANVLVTGLSIVKFTHGIHVFSPATGAKIAGNFIGLLPGGAPGGNLVGVVVNASGVTIGGPTNADRNIISSNSQAGIELNGAGVTGFTILRNVIGLDKNGSTSGNGKGIYAAISGGGIIGQPGGGNYIQSNSVAGIYIVDFLSTQSAEPLDQIPSGLTEPSATPSGAALRTAAGNANRSATSVSASSSNTAGQRAAVRTIKGVAVEPAILMGPPPLTLISSNTVDFNGTSGIYIGVIANTEVAANFIRSNQAGLNIDFGIDANIHNNDISNNTGAGIVLSGGGPGFPMNASIHDNTIANNINVGILLFSGATAVDYATNNIIVGNGVLGVDLNNDGITTPNDDLMAPYDTDSGANQLLNFPNILGVTATSATTATINYELRSQAGLLLTPGFAICFCKNPSGGNQCEVPVATCVTPNNEALGVYTSVPPASLTGLTVGSKVTAFTKALVGATKAGNVSEISPGVAFLVPPVITFATAPTSIVVGGTSVGTLTINNPNTVPLTASAFTFNYLPGLVNAPAPSASSTCPGATPTATPGAALSATSTGFTIPASSSCTFSVTITSSVAAVYSGTISAGLIVTPAGNSNATPFSITVTPAAVTPVITSIASASGVVGNAFSYSITAANTPTSFNATGLPPGLTPNTVTGLISGTPTVAGTFAATISATNVAGTGTQGLSITISAALPPAPAINSPATASGVTGTAFSYAITASNSPTSFNASGLPAGLAINTSTGLISGIPTVAGTFAATISATNASGTGTQALSITITATTIAPTITSTAPPAGNVGTAYSRTFTATGTAPITWTLTTGTLPSGLTLNSTTGVLSGTPTVAGSFTFTIQAANGTLPNATQSNTIVITTATVAPTITSTPTSTGTVGNSYSRLFSASGTTPITWSVTSGALPTGLTLNATTGIVSGTPTVAGAFTFTIQAANGTLPNATQSNTITITAATTAPTITSASPASGSVGSSYSHTFAAAGTTPITWSVATGTLPAGLTLNAASGILNGTPTSAGTFTFTIQAANGTPPNATQNITININAATAAPTITFALSPTSITTGGTTVGTVTINNSNATPLTANAFTFAYVPGLVNAANPNASSTCSGAAITATPGAGGFGQTTSFTIPASGSCTFSSTVTTNTAGTYTGAVPAGLINTSTGSSPASNSVTLIVTVAQAPAVTLSPLSVNFGARTVNTTSPPTAVTLTNSGTGALTINGITGSGDFGFTSTCPLLTATLAPLAPCAINVTFTPLTVAALSGAISVTSNATGSPHRINLSGSGTAAPVPGISIAPAALTFAARTVNTTSATQNVTVTNTGFANLALSSINVGAPFSRVALAATANPPDCASSLAPGSSCQIGVAFTPTGTGALSGTISITDNADGSPHTVTLTGTGTPVPVAVISLTSPIAFGDQIINTASSTRNITVTNTGTATLTISGITITGTNAANFTLTGQSGCTSLAPTRTCTLAVTFTPTTAGGKSAQVNITSNAQNAATVNAVSLSGNGTLAPRPVLRLSLTTIGFGNIILGGATPSQVVTLTNSGGVTLNITNIAVAGDFAETNNCGSTVAPLASCTINISFTPAVPGAISGELIVATDAVTSPDRVQLSGTGCRWFSQAQSRFFLTSCG